MSVQEGDVPFVRVCAILPDADSVAVNIICGGRMVVCIVVMFLVVDVI